MTDHTDTLTLSWTPRPAEFADAYHARLQDVGASRGPLVIAVGLAVFAGLLILVPGIALLGLIIGTPALFLSWFRVGKTIIERRWATVFALNPTFGETRTTTFGDNGVATETARTSSVWSWSAFTSWSDAPRAVVLATSDVVGAVIVVVPHHAAFGQVEALKGVVERHLGPALRSRPRRSRLWGTWAARALVVACLTLPLWFTLDRVHDQGGEWRLTPSEAPPRVTYDDVEYTRTGEPTTSRPSGSYSGAAYTPGGGLIMLRLPTPAKPPELWVLDHVNVVRHYVIRETPAA